MQSYVFESVYCWRRIDNENNKRNDIIAKSLCSAESKAVSLLLTPLHCLCTALYALGIISLGEIYWLNISKCLFFSQYRNTRRWQTTARILCMQKIESKRKMETFCFSIFYWIHYIYFFFTFVCPLLPPHLHSH